MDYKNSINPNAQIIYSFVSKKIKIGGRGDYYQMKIKYKENEHLIDLTSREFELIDSKSYPILYESKNTGKLFSNWVMRRTLRIIIIFSSLSIIAIFPWRLIIQRIINKIG